MSVKKAVKQATPEPTKAELLATKVAASKIAWRTKRERVHKGATNANVEPADA